MERVKVMIWDKVSLVVLERKDIDLWYKGMNDLEVLQYIFVHFWQLFYRENEEEFYENLLKDKTNRTFWIFINSQELNIWNISLHHISEKDRTAELWVAIFDKEEQNKGHWTEAIKLILKYGFEVLWLRKVWLRYIDFNVRWEKVYERVWFKEVGRLKKENYIKWKYHDEVIMEIFKEEFKG